MNLADKKKKSIIQVYMYVFVAILWQKSSRSSFVN